MFKDIPQIPRVPLTVVLRVDRMTRIEPQNFPPHNQMLEKHKARRRQHTQTIPTVSNNAPARNTRSHTRTMAEATSRSRPNTRYSKRTSQLTRATPARRNKTTRSENTAAVQQRRNIRYLKQTTQKLSNIEIGEQQAMVVMDEQTGLLLNYKQLMRDPKYKKNWSTSSANEFGRLANVVGGRIKIPQTHSSSSKERTSPGPEGRMLLMVPLCEMSAIKKPIKTERVLSSEDTESTILVR